MHKIPKKLGEILIERNLVTERQLLSALNIQRIIKKSLGEILVQEGYIDKETLEAALARQYGSRLGEILINAKLINFEQLQHAFNIQKAESRPLGDILIELNYITEEHLLEAQSKQYNLKIVNLSEYTINPEAFSKVPTDVLKYHHILPIDIKEGTLVVATSDPDDVLAVSDIRFISGMHVELALASRQQIQSMLE